MGRDSKRITDEYIEQVKSRLTRRDIDILKFVAEMRVVTSDQIARYFWRNANNAKFLAPRRLKVLYDLHLINRFFPRSLSGGSVHQHVVLDRAGVKLLNLESYSVAERLPANYRHTVLVAEWRLQTRLHGLGWGTTGERVGSLVPDVWYPSLQLAVEIDAGTEGLRVLTDKAKRYNLLNCRVIFVTTGGRGRLQHLSSKMSRHVDTAEFSDVTKLIEKLSEKLNLYT